MPTTELILTENIPGLGAEADRVKVRPGFARNYLLPQGKAYSVTPEALRKLDSLRAKRAEREARELNESEELARKLNKLKLTFTLETGEAGKAFGSVTVKDIADRIAEELKGVEIERSRIQLDRPIKETGSQEIPIKLHADVTAKLSVKVQSASAPEEAPKEEPEQEKGYKAKPKARHSK